MKHHGRHRPMPATHPQPTTAAAGTVTDDVDMGIDWFHLERAAGTLNLCDSAGILSTSICSPAFRIVNRNLNRNLSLPAANKRENSFRFRFSVPIGEDSSLG